MDSEITPVVETEEKEGTEEKRGTEPMFVELGLVTKDTQGFGQTLWDGGIGRQW